MLYFYDSDELEDRGFFSIFSSIFGSRSNEDKEILNQITEQYHVMKLDIVDPEISRVIEEYHIYTIPWIQAYHEKKLLLGERPTFGTPDGIEMAALEFENSSGKTGKEVTTGSDFGHFVVEPIREIKLVEPLKVDLSGTSMPASNVSTNSTPPHVESLVKPIAGYTTDITEIIKEIMEEEEAPIVVEEAPIFVEEEITPMPVLHNQLRASQTVIPSTTRVPTKKPVKNYRFQAYPRARTSS